MSPNELSAMNPIQAILCYWKEYAYKLFVRLKLRAVYWFVHRTQAEATADIKETETWLKSLTYEETTYLYKLVQDGETDLRTSLTAMRARKK